MLPFARGERAYGAVARDAAKDCASARPAALGVLCRGGDRQGDVRAKPERGRDPLPYAGAAVFGASVRERPPAAAGDGAKVRPDDSELIRGTLLLFRQVQCIL